MEISSILKEYTKHKKIAELNKLIIKDSVKQIYCEGLQMSSLSFVFAAMFQRQQKVANALFILSNEEEASYFFQDFLQLTNKDETLFFPSSYRRAIKYAQKNDGYEILRTEVLSKLSKSEKSHFIITYPEALSELVVSEKSLSTNTIAIKKGDKLDLTQFEKLLIEKGMKRTNYVYSPGEFAVRGSIIDIYSFTSELPYRIDFFGDEVESIRTFELQTQLSKDKTDEIIIVPELEVSKMEDKNICSLANFLPKDTLVIYKNKDFILADIEKTYKSGFSAQANIINNEKDKDANNDKIKLLEKKSIIISKEEFEKSFINFKTIEIGHNHKNPKANTIYFDTQIQPTYSKNFDLISESFLKFKELGYSIYIAADSEKQHERLKSIFENLNSNATFTSINASIHEGFIDNDLHLCIFTDHQIFGRYHKFQIQGQHTKRAKVSLAIKDLKMFHQGDYIVHIDHGIGKFAGLVRIPTDKGMQEVIKLVYKNNDIVLVSIHSLYKLSKYKSKDGEEPKISQIGTGAWQKFKNNTKSKVKDIARDLILLYSKRKEKEGFAFSPDDYMQKELEASFVYDDTPDQLKVTQEVKRDMESIRPMDRLVCGDVGFGKTEIAMRAAFKAVLDDKQVAILVPTTVLAMQHYETFKKRLKKFPVTIDYLSRARSAKSSKEVIKKLGNGEINIIIGTHKLIGKTVIFKDLGLLIIDEEQKFGVGVKEKLRKMKINVDTLTLSATPIPRTLQFSLMGARDMSVISTPPPNRQPIETEVHTFNSQIITEAINFELSRNGQVYFVCNRIAELPHIAALIHQYIPDARVGIGHGQMPSKDLEKIILNFIDHEYDILLSTTIIENGIDISNANTIIIDHANNFGLSDLHQMRGRVGRSNKKAFCYLLAPPLSTLTNDAKRRLQAIENFSDLGSGTHIALHDLDIRGAGNILGGEQSGFIANLGFETYHKILNEAIEELKIEEFSHLEDETTSIQNNNKIIQYVSECNVDSDLPIYFHETYIPESSERMLLYRELDNLKEEKDIKDYQKRLIDRFGPIPHEGKELINIVRLRRLGMSLGIERIFLKQNRLTLYFLEDKKSLYYQEDAFTKILQYTTSNYQTCRLTDKGGRPRIIISNVNSVENATLILNSIENEKVKNR